MAQYINTNIASINAQRNLSSSQLSLQTSLQRLSSGMRINSAKDDASGLVISESMTTQVRGLDQAVRNANDGISMSQTAEGALTVMGDMLQRMRELTVQASNGTNSTSSWAAIDAEYQKLGNEINRVASSTTFNGATIIGAGATTTSFQVGSNSGAADQVSIATTDRSTIFSGGIATNIVSTATANSNMVAVDAAIGLISTDRAALGAAQNTFQFTIQNLQNASENTSAARSRITDTDFAAETGRLTRSQILQQAGTAMLAQANAVPNGVMALLR